MRAGALTPQWLADMAACGGVDAAWERIFRELPRTLLMPEAFWVRDAQGREVCIDRAEDPDGWAAWAERDVPLVTQWADQPAPDQPGQTALSSSSQPSLVAGMLTDLDVQSGHRVLDAGTGTGWTTALLAARAGSDRVVGVEYDPQVAAAARERIRAAGLSPLVVTGDGAAGWPEGAPYDRIQCTYAVRRIPPAWVEQTRPGGVILTPWETTLTPDGALVRLTVRGDGTACGPFVRPVRFMGSRTNPPQWVNREDYLPSGGGWPPGTVETTTSLRPGDLWENPGSGAWWTVGLLVPDMVHATTTRADGTVLAWLFSLRCRSWAIVFFDEDPVAEVHQRGPRRLWDEVEVAYRWWQQQGRPGREGFGLTVSPDGERVWLRSPEQVLPPEGALRAAV